MSVRYVKKSLPEKIMEIFPDAVITAQGDNIIAVEFPDELTVDDVTKLEAVMGKVRREMEQGGGDR